MNCADIQWISLWVGIAIGFVAAFITFISLKG